METDFWLERWRLSQIGFHQQEINAHLQEFWPGLAIAPKGQVFVPLCGKSRDMLWLRARGHKLLEVEVSPIAVRDFFSENGLTPRISAQGRFERWESDGLEIVRGDFFDLVPGDLHDVRGVYDRASLATARRAHPCPTHVTTMSLVGRMSGALSAEWDKRHKDDWLLRHAAEGAALFRPMRAAQFLTRPYWQHCLPRAHSCSG